MKYKLVFTQSYTRRAIKFVRKHPEILIQYQKTLELLELNPFHPSLRLHKLKGAFENLHSVSINISYRITIEFLIEGKTIIPVNVGTHDQVY
ncbi:MAG: plasmid stabilization protein [Lentisphaerae bacterium RIFOXYA12_FULL_48_11]|nr:MAG: plasmid stabilization protein [Lentisphaerae bacterium RIFOXYA12_FULL_48_11]